jgi:predicted TIM-barrel enzyme
MKAPEIIPGSPQLIAMVHAHTNNALQNTQYNDGFGVSTYSTKELAVLEEARKKLSLLLTEAIKETGLDILNLCRSSVFLLKRDAVEKIEKQVAEIGFVNQIVERALREVDIYTRNGINIIAVENVGAPYFIGNEVSWEDLLVLNIVCKSIRAKFPNIHMGFHVLSSNEIEALPIAIISKAFFVRSESSIFSGFRPEGKTINRGNLAKFFYLRNYLHAKNGAESASDRRFPAIWSDLQKKHTVFEEEIADLNVWLDNILFQKLEGIILTGAETGSDIAEQDLSRGREAIEKVKKQSNEIFDGKIEINIPLITGSGMDMDMYKKYADFIITGTQLKENKYWENGVEEKYVKELVEKLKK